MLLDLTLEVTPKMKKDARENEKKAFTGHLGTHFDVMDKVFPLEYSRREGIVFDVSEAGEEISLSDIAPDRIREGMAE